MLTSRPLTIDGIEWGTIFLLGEKGDCFPVHEHTDLDNHITIVAFGSVRVIGHPDHEGMVLEAKPGGTIVNWPVGKPHGFIAVSDGATLVNVIKSGFIKP